MTTQEALAIVEQIRLAVNGTGKDHDQARTAVETLREAVTPKDPAPAPSNEPAGQG